MRPTGRQFRVFVSSTFSDFKHEREALQERVFPELRTYCESRGARFQAIDLRWGISESAAREHQTVRICLEEIRRSQRLSPRPNFIALLGNRYGWRPIPEEIPAEELEQLNQYFSVDEQALIDNWYGRDDNAVPPIYYLRPRPEWLDDVRWDMVNTDLAKVLRRAVTRAALPETVRLKYFASAAHLEVSKGLLNVPDAGQHVFAYCREIEGLSEGAMANSTADFMDVQDGTRDTEAETAQSDLKAQIRAQLPDHTHDYHARWLDCDISLDHLDTFCADVEADLKAVIDHELEQLETIDPLEWEAEQHRKFAEELSQVFVGRQTELAHIAKYFSSDSTTPLVIHGTGGVGKSALVAKAIENIDSNGTILIQRFIGATPESSRLRPLLTSLCQELSRRYGADEVVNYEKLAELFGMFTSRLALANAERPLVLVLDSLDQLDDADVTHQLKWLPQTLPSVVKVIASTRDNQEGGEPFPVYQVAKQRYRQGLMSLGGLQRNEGDKALDALLGRDRNLTTDQRSAVLGEFKVTGLPLYLKLAAEQAKRWRSDTQVTGMPADIHSLIRAFIEQLKAPANHGPLLVERALAYLQAGRYNGLAEEELTRALALDEDVMTEFFDRALQPWSRPELPPILWSRLHADLDPYLKETNIDGALLHRFFHREFSEVIEADSLREELELARHSTLARIFAWRSDPGAYRNSYETTVLRQIMELPYQLHLACEIKSLQSLLKDFNYVFTKCAANRSDDLLNSYLKVEQLHNEMDTDFNAWIDFIRSRAHLLRRGTPQWPAHKIFQQLAIEYADTSPVTQAAEAWLATDNCDWLWLHAVRRPNRPTAEPCLAVMAGHTWGISGAQILPDGRFLSWSYDVDHTPRLWSAEGIPLTTLEGHSGSINGFYVFPDGRLLSWSADHTLRLWSVDGTQLSILKGHTDSVCCVQALPNGHFLSWSRHKDHTLRIWSDEGAPISVLQGHSGEIAGVQVLPDGQILSWSLGDGTLRLWSIDGTPITILKGHTMSVNGVQALPDGRLLSWSGDRTLRIWSGAGVPLAVLEGHTDEVFDAQALPDGRILSWSWDCSLRLWSDEGAPLAVMKGHTKLVEGAQMLPDGRLLSWSDDHTLRLWSGEGMLLASLEGHTGSVKGVHVHPNNRLMSWSDDHTLRLWSGDGAPLAILEGHTRSVNGSHALSDGRFLSWSDDRTLRLWSEEGTPLASLEGHTGSVKGVHVLPNNRLLSWSNDHTLRLWSDITIQLVNLEGHKAYINGAQVLPDGCLLSWSEDCTLRLWSAEAMPLATLEGHTGCVKGAHVLSDGRLLSWSDDNTLRLWSSNGSPLAILKGHTDQINHVQALTNGRFISESRDGTLRLWSDNGAPLAVLKGDTDDPIVEVQELPDGRLLSRSLHNDPRLWSADGTPETSLKGHTDNINGIQVIPDGRILSWSDDHTLRLWSEKGMPLSILKGHMNSIWQVKILPNGCFLSWCYKKPMEWISDRTLRLWSSNGSPLAILKGHTDQINYVQALTNGRFISESRDGTLRLWSDNGTPLAVLKGDTDDPIVEVQELPDGRLLSRSLHNDPRLWSADGTPETSLKGHTDNINGIQVIPDGRILSWSDDRQMLLWTSLGEPLAMLEVHTGFIRDLYVLSNQQILALLSDGIVTLWELSTNEQGISAKGIPLISATVAMSYVPYLKLLTKTALNKTAGLSVITPRFPLRLQLFSGRIPPSDSRQ